MFFFLLIWLSPLKAHENVAGSNPTTPIARDLPTGTHNVIDRHSAPSAVYANVSPFVQHDLDSHKFVENTMFLNEMQSALSLLMNMQRSFDKGTKDTRRMSANVLFERNEIMSNTTLFQAETNLVQHNSGGQSSSLAKKTCHKSEPVYASIVPRPLRIVRRSTSRVTVRKKPTAVSTNFDTTSCSDCDDEDYSLVIPRRHSDPPEIRDVKLFENPLNSRELGALHRKWVETIDVLKDKYEAVSNHVKGEKDEIVRKLGLALAVRTLKEKSEGSLESSRKSKINGLDSTLEELVGGWDAELAAYAEEIAFHEAMSVAMDYVSNEIVMAEAMQGLHTRSKQLHEIILAESESCSKVLNLFKENAGKRYECLQKGLEDVVIVTNEEVRQSYYDAMTRIQRGSDEVDFSKDIAAKEALDCLIGTLADMMLTLAVVEGVIDYLCQEGCDIGLEKHSNVGIVTDLDIMDGIPSPRTPSPCSELSDDVDLIDLDTEVCHPSGSVSTSIAGSRDGFEAFQGCDLEQVLVDSEAKDFALILADKALAHAEAVYVTDCVQDEWERTVEDAHASVMETLAAEHAHNIATIREKYEILLREQCESHTSQLASLQERYNDTLLKIDELQEECDKVVALHANKPDIAVTMVQDVDEIVEEMMANRMQRMEDDMEATRIRLKEARIQLEIQSEEHVQEMDAITGFMETMERKHKEELDGLRVQYIRRVEEIETDMRRRMDHQRDTHEKELIEVVRMHRQELTRMNEEHKTAFAAQVSLQSAVSVCMIDPCM